MFISGGKSRERKMGKTFANKGLGTFNSKEGPDQSLLELTQTALLSPALRGPEVWPVSGGCSSPCLQALHPHPLSIGRVSLASQARIALGRKRTSRGQARKGHFSARTVLSSPVVARTGFSTGHEDAHVQRRQLRPGIIRWRTR